MSNSRNYSRFRVDGRSGTETYLRLYSRENCIPRPGSKPHSSGLRDLLKNDKAAYSNGTPAVAPRTETLGQRWQEFYSNAPEPVRIVGDKVSSAARQVRAWPYLKAAARTVIIIAAVVILAFGAVITAGFNALSSEELISELSIYYDELKAYKPNGESPVQSGYNLGELSSYSETDASGTDVSVGGAPEGKGYSSLSFVSECDVRNEGRRMDAVMKAGLDSFSSAGLDIELYYVTEAGTRELSPTVYGKNGNRNVEFVVAPTREQLDTVGCHTLRIATGGKERNVLLIVKDTKAPSVTLQTVSIWLGDSVSPEMFVSDSDDVSPLVVNYSNGEPDLSLVGEQLVYLQIKDISGNEVPFDATYLVINEDTEPPVISGARNRTVVIGETVSYKQGVTAMDNRDGEVSVKVDSSAVDPTKAGSYDVIYTATDKNGNTSSVTVTFKFGTQAELDIDVELEGYVVKVAKKIFKSGMTDAQKAKAIYDWCRRNISYSGHADKGNWKKAAITGFKKHSGDCYTYFACSKALFEYCGIENIDVVKVKNSSSESSHYWSLVNVGTGYYHFDATPRVGGFNGFMRTDKQIKSYSSSHKNSHRFNAALYPATPTESFSG